MLFASKASRRYSGSHGSLVEEDSSSREAVRVSVLESDVEELRRQSRNWKFLSALLSAACFKLRVRVKIAQEARIGNMVTRKWIVSI
jgi:hypothetical protein